LQLYPGEVKLVRQFIVVGGIGRRETPAQRLIAFVIRVLIIAAGVWVAAKLVGGIHLEGWKSTLLVALVLGVLNAYLKPLLVFGTFPLLILTVGLFLIIINTALLALTAWFLGKFDSVHFAIDGFWDAFWGAVIISLVTFLLTRFIDPRRMARNFS
jgi:putative membrane protein